MGDARTTLLAAIAPAIWGSTYYVTTEFLPDGYPLTVAMLRALPAGLLLLLLVRRLPRLPEVPRVATLGALNFSIFWALLFVAAYRLPGGVAATVGAVQPLVVIFLSRLAIGAPIRALSIIAALAGLAGVALLVLTPAAALDPIGVLAGLGGAVSMSAGTVFSRKWRPADASHLTFTAWQLTAGGLLLAPFALWFEPELPAVTSEAVIGIAYLGLIGAALTYVLWFRGVARLDPAALSALGFLSPVSALLLGWLLLGQELTELQLAGFVIVPGGVWLGQSAPRAARSAPNSALQPANP